jgi:hypothetical protein
MQKRGEIKRLKRVEPSQSDVEEVKSKNSILDRIEEELGDESIELFDNSNIDSNYLKLPFHLDDIQSNELGRYLHAFTQQKIWARTLFSRVKAIIYDETEKLRVHKERVFSGCDKKLSITEKEIRLSVDPQAKPILERLEYAQQKAEMLATYIDNLDDGIFDVSREVSRRGGDFKDQNRLENVSNKRRK